MDVKVKQATMNNILDESARMNLEIRALKRLLGEIEFSDRGTCPVCGGADHHDSVCELAALIDPEHARSYEAQTGMSIINAKVFDAENAAARLVKPLKHTLFVGPQGLGKTRQMQALAREKGGVVIDPHGNIGKGWPIPVVTWAEAVGLLEGIPRRYSSLTIWGCCCTGMARNQKK